MPAARSAAARPEARRPDMLESVLLPTGEPVRTAMHRRWTRVLGSRVLAQRQRLRPRSHRTATTTAPALQIQASLTHRCLLSQPGSKVRHDRHAYHESLWL